MVELLAADGFEAPREPLTEREAEVLDLASFGLTNAQIAMSLGVTIHAVKFHLAGIYRKLGVSNRTTAVSIYFRTQAIPAGD